MKTILCDMDAIIADLHTAWYRDYNEMAGDDLHMSKVVEWNTAKFCKTPDLLWKALNQVGLYEKVQPIVQAIRVMQNLHEAGHRVVIASACSVPHHYSEKVVWLKKHTPWLPKTQIMLGDAKDLLHADVLVDDGPHNIRAYRAKWGSGPLIITPAYPYNADCGELAVRVHDWTCPNEAWFAIENCILHHLSYS